MIPFDYRKVSTLEEAFRLLDEYGPRAGILAGGTDLLNRIRRRSLNPALLIDLKGVPDLDAIQYEPEAGLRIGALASIHSLEASPHLKNGYTGIAEAAASLGSYQVRCRATLGGNLCSASPAADMVPPLVAFGARLRITGRNGERRLPVEEFIAGPGRTRLLPGELLVEVQVPPPGGAVSRYAKYTVRNAMDRPVVCAAVCLWPSEDRAGCASAKIALGASGPVCIRAAEAEDLLRGQRLDEGIISRAARLAAEGTRPISDIRAGAEYRREMAGVLTRRLLAGIWSELKSAGGVP